MEKQTSAATRPSSVLLEQLSVCLNKGEPLLLVGETGTGKTSTVQYLANIAGLQIRVVNMNQQSDTADLLGGYKPVDHKLVLPPLRKSFKNLFSQTFSRRQNSTFLGHVQSCFREKCWQDLLKLMDHVCKSAVNKEPQKKQQNAALLKEQWEAFSLRTHLVLIQGENSVSKTSLIKWLAAATGKQCVRINNHEHTDIQEYIGCYSSDTTGKLVFREGYWIILEELNLAPTDVLEALNRLLDENRELFISETQEVVKAHPRFMLFATQNPPGLYGGRKVLSRAFRNRFVELHFDELPSGELESILHKRCSLPPSYCTKLIRVMLELHIEEARQCLLGSMASSP